MTKDQSLVIRIFFLSRQEVAGNVGLIKRKLIFFGCNVFEGNLNQISLSIWIETNFINFPAPLKHFPVEITRNLIFTHFLNTERRRRQKIFHGISNEFIVEYGKFCFMITRVSLLLCPGNVVDNLVLIWNREKIGILRDKGRKEIGLDGDFAVIFRQCSQIREDYK